MILYAGTGRQMNRHILVFGNGLIGSAINSALRSQHRWERHIVAWPWHERSGRQLAASLSIDLIRESHRIDLVWAAGTSGFGSTDADMALETDHLSEVAELAVILAKRSDQFIFHLFSSLGGLCEGQRLIDRKAAPSPRRAYGLGKMRQEQLVDGLGDHIVPRVYRPSSVYGVAHRGRRGLFASAAMAMLQQKPLTVYGSANTLRDYVFARDIGTYVARLMTEQTVESDTVILASGKPTTVTEAIFAMETLFGRRLYCRYESSPHNSLDMTVRMSALPSALPHTALSVGIASVLQHVARSLAR